VYDRIQQLVLSAQLNGMLIDLHIMKRVSPSSISITSSYCLISSQGFAFSFFAARMRVEDETVDLEGAVGFCHRQGGRTFVE